MMASITGHRYWLMSLANYDDDNVPKSSVFIFQLPFHSFSNLLIIKFTIHSCGNLLCFYNCLLSKRNCLCCLFLRNKFFWKYHKKAIVLLYFWKQQSKLCIFLLGKTSIFHKVQNIMYNRFNLLRKTFAALRYTYRHRVLHQRYQQSVSKGLTLEWTWKHIFYHWGNFMNNIWLITVSTSIYIFILYDN